MGRWPPGPKLTPKIILEGTRLTHKTDRVFALNEHPRIVGPRKYRYHSPLVSAEWCAFREIADWMTGTGGLWAPGAGSLEAVSGG